jgi:opacity protein-like surface antigen
VIDGVITKYHEGNPMLRAFIGMGAGSAFFEADVYFRNSEGNIIGKIKADKNSWALGGGLAAAQNPTMFMNGAAAKIAEEAVKLR